MWSLNKHNFIPIVTIALALGALGACLSPSQTDVERTPGEVLRSYYDLAEMKKTSVRLASNHEGKKEVECRSGPRSTTFREETECSTVLQLTENLEAGSLG
jgi:hypothetical protein